MSFEDGLPSGHPLAVALDAVYLVADGLVVVAEAAVDEVAPAAEGVDGVVVIAAGEFIDAVAAGDVVRAVAAVDVVLAGAVTKVVVTGTAVDVVVALAARDRVSAGLAVELVVAPRPVTVSLPPLALTTSPRSVPPILSFFGVPSISIAKAVPAAMSSAANVVATRSVVLFILNSPLVRRARWRADQISNRCRMLLHAGPPRLLLKYDSSHPSGWFAHPRRATSLSPGPASSASAEG